MQTKPLTPEQVVSIANALRKKGRKLPSVGNCSTTTIKGQRLSVCHYAGRLLDRNSIFAHAFYLEKTSRPVYTKGLKRKRPLAGRR